LNIFRVEDKSIKEFISFLKDSLSLFSSILVHFFHPTKVEFYFQSSVTLKNVIEMEKINQMRIIKSKSDLKRSSNYSTCNKFVVWIFKGFRKERKGLKDL